MNKDSQDFKNQELTEKATNIEFELLLKFGSKPEIKRKVFDNFRK